MEPTFSAALTRLVPALLIGTLLAACGDDTAGVNASGSSRAARAAALSAAVSHFPDTVAAIPDTGADVVDNTGADIPGIPAAAPSVSAQTMIAGTAATTAIAGTPYAFKPTASAQGEVTFSVQNLPAWARFDADTGTISGTPTLAHLGTYSNIRISATSDGSIASLAAFNIAVLGVANGNVSLSWTPPTLNTDGTPITNLAGYRVYYGSSPDQLSNKIDLSNAGLTTYVIGNLGAGRHYFAVTAYSSVGSESDKSSVGTKTI